jgi:hypothetical protein
MNEISERNPRFLIGVSGLYNNFCRFACSRTIPAVGKARKHADKFSAVLGRDSPSRFGNT